MAVIVVEENGTGGQPVLVRPTFNFQYFSTPSGILLLVQFVVGVIIFVLGAPFWLDIVAWIAWLISHFLIWVYLFSLNERYTSSPPFKVVEFYVHGVITLSYALCSLFCLIFLYWIVGIFAVINTCAYAGSAFFLFSEWTAHRSALK